MYGHPLTFIQDCTPGFYLCPSSAYTDMPLPDLLFPVRVQVFRILFVIAADPPVEEFFPAFLLGVPAVDINGIVEFL